MKRTQIYLLIAGIILLFLGGCLYYFRIDSIITVFIASAGPLCFLRCLMYKERPAGTVLTGEQRDAYAQTSYFRISVIGMTIMFSGFGVGLLADYLHVTPMVMWGFGLAILGMIFIVVARIFKKHLMKTDKTCEASA